MLDPQGKSKINKIHEVHGTKNIEGTNMYMKILRQIVKTAIIELKKMLLIIENI